MANSTKLLAKKLANIVKAPKEARLINQADLHERTKISRTNLDHYLRGTASAKLDTLDRIAEALSIKPWQLIQPEEDKSQVEKLFPPKLLEEICNLNQDDMKFVVENLGIILKALRAHNREK